MLTILALSSPEINLYLSLRTAIRNLVPVMEVDDIYLDS
jgi:hypothetical protein